MRDPEVVTSPRRIEEHCSEERPETRVFIAAEVVGIVFPAVALRTFRLQVLPAVTLSAAQTLIRVPPASLAMHAL